MSAIPPLYEGTPLRSDNYILTFTPVGSVSVGNIVTMASTTGGSGWSVAATASNSSFFLGVALTTGGLTSGAFSSSAGQAGLFPITVITRGVVDVIADGTVNIGDYLVPSAATTGYVHSTSTVPFSVSAAVTRAVALSPSTTNGTRIQAFLF